jgi:tetratricopeptide (TPR) repeat protein
MLADLIARAAARVAPAMARISASALSAALAAASPAYAQDAPTPDDLRALIYYSVNGDAEAAAAELRRLRALFPEWTPPEDPSAPAALGPDAEAIERIYRAIAEKRIPQAQNAVEALRREYPGWTPPDDMTRLIDLEVAQAAFTAAIGAEDADEALAIARREPALRRCDRVNNVWLLAELQARQGQRSEPLAAYRAILSACSEYDVVKATLEKSSALQDSAWLRASFDAVRPRFPDRDADLDALERRLLGGSAPAQIAEAGSASRPAASSAQAPARAATTTRRAVRTPSGLPARGDKRIRSVQRASEAENWAECVRSSHDPKSLDVLYQRSWCVYALGRPLEALVGFNAALLGGLDANATRDAAYGAALSYLSLGAVDDAALVAASHSMVMRHRVEIESGILDQRGVAAYQAGDYAAAIASFDELERLQGRLRRDLGVLRAYAYKHLGDRATSHSLFRQIHNGAASARTDAALRGLAGVD